VRALLLAAIVPLLAACHAGVVISNSPPPIGACAPPNPATGCR
jgi:hypothetical protein